MRKIGKLALSAGAITAAFALTGMVSAQTSTGGWAVVAPDGTLGHNANVKSVDHTSPGVYLVRFDQDVSGCAANATIAGAGKKSIVPAYIVVSHTRKDNTIKVNTFLSATLLPADFRFDIIAMC